MDQSSPQGGTPERPRDETPTEGQQPGPQPQDPYAPPPSAPPSAGYNPPPQVYAPTGYTSPPQGQEGAPTGYNPPQQGAPQGYMPPVYPQQGQGQGQQPPQGGYAPHPGYPQQPGAPPPGYPPGYAPQGGPPPGYYPTGYAPQQQRRKGIPVWGWILIVGALLVLLVCGGSLASLFYVGSRVNETFSRLGVDLARDLGPTATTIGFYTSLSEGEYDAAASLLSGDLKSRYSADELRNQWTALTGKAGDVTASLPTSIDVSGDTASLTQQLVSSNGQTYSVDLKLERRGNASDNPWMIIEANPGLIPSP